MEDEIVMIYCGLVNYGHDYDDEDTVFTDEDRPIIEVLSYDY